MHLFSRRSLLVGTAACFTLPSAAARADDADPHRLRDVLDRAARDPEAALADLRGFDAAALPLGARLDLQTARAGLAVDAELARRFPVGRPGRSPYLVTPTSGAWTRAEAPADAIQRETRSLRADAARGFRLPRGLIERTIAALDTARAAATGPRAEALAEQQALLRAQLGDSPPPGMSALPGGVAYYSLLLRRTTGDDVVPERLRARLERERRRTVARAERLFAAIGIRTGSLGQRFSTLWQDPRWLYPDNDAGRTRAVADMNRQLERVQPLLPRWFGPLPPEVRAVQTQRMAAAEEVAGKQGYRIVPEGTRPGRYVVDLRTILRRPVWTLPAVVHHELLPGHMVQLPLEARAGPHALRIDYAQAFTEGWAIYAEGLAARAGLYKGDAHAELGFCHWRLFRLCRAIGDLDLHLAGHSPEEVLEDWRMHLGEPAYFAPFAQDLDRVLIEPAVRAAEAASWLAIEELSLGRAPIPFHQAVLGHGRMRTDMMRQTVTGRMMRR